MTRKGEGGFSVVELLIVCAVVGIIAAIAVPHLQKALRATENGNTFATIRTVASTQVNFFSQNNRFGRITEINNLLASAIGTNSGNEVIRGKFVLAMTPAAPTDAELRNGYTLTATRNVAGEGVVYVYQVTQTGEIRQILP
jgi:prepilin-type N-terminal cleavage/methylation domain-containing protein